jgi:hypothetical protein
MVMFYFVLFSHYLAVFLPDLSIDYHFICDIFSLVFCCFLLLWATSFVQRGRCYSGGGAHVTL